MRKILHTKAGVTVLEGVIALGLLALITAGSFGVLLSASRQKSQPDMRENLMYAVETADHLLQAYTPWNPGLELDKQTYLQQQTVGYFRKITDTFLTPKGPCGAEIDVDKVLEPGLHSHALNCLLPFMCDRTKSEFSYTVEEGDSVPTGDGNSNVPMYQIKYAITCNGYQL